jgi:hypothetical protein
VRRALVSLAALGGAALAVAVAADALRWEQRLATDDRRLVAGPASPGLWQPAPLLPFSASARLLGLREDVEYRRTLRRFWSVRPGQPIVGPDLEALRGQVESELARHGRDTSVAERRSHVLNLLGVLTVGRYYGTNFGAGTSGAPSDPAERAAIVRTALGLFQAAVEADGGNRDAKLNLELLLRDLGASEFVADTPAGQAEGGRGTGAGRAGAGY